MNGRPTDGPNHVDRLTGPDDRKHRLRVILETLSGRKTVKQASAELGISEARFHVLRREALQAALDGLEPRHAGRPREADAAEAAGDPRALREEIEDLRGQLHAAEVRTEIGLTMPHLLRGRDPDRRRRSPGGGR